MAAQFIDLWVSAGSLEAPYYRFYTDAEGRTELEALVLDASKSYTFRLLNAASSHPFYLKADPDSQGESDAYRLSGDGSSAVGISGNQSFTLSFDNPSQAPPSLLTYCTAHPSMQSAWSVKLAPSTPSVPDLVAASDSGSSDSDNITNNATPTFVGSAEAGSTVELFAGDISLGTTTADSSGDWAFTLAGTHALSDGSYAITATASTVSGGSRANVESSLIAVASPGRTHQEYRNRSAFAVIKDDGSVVTWGGSSYGGDSSSVSAQLSSGVSQIFSNYNAFAALKEDGSVITWGDASSGGDSSSVSLQLSSGVSQIFSSWDAFAALKDDGSVITWGNSEYGGGDSSSVSTELSSGVSQIFSNGNAFAALKDDGSVITWGYPDRGGDSSSVSDQLSSGVTQLFSTGGAFAALKNDGSVITWGDSYSGAVSSSVSASLSSGVSQIFSTLNAFAALKDDGSVITWGTTNLGGDSSSVSTQLSSGVREIFSNYNAFAALKDDGSVITWGNSSSGGDSSSVSIQLSSGVTQLFATHDAFAALKDNGSVITWGNSSAGGDSSSVSTELSSGVSQIFSNLSAFAALKDDGSVITWGHSSNGGDNSSVSNQLSSGVTQIFSTGGAFAALKDDGSVITWGRSIDGGYSSSVSDQLSSAVVAFADPFHDDRVLMEPIFLTSEPSAALTLNVDATAPVFTSPVTASEIDENSGDHQLVYTAAVTDTSSISYSLKADHNDDGSAFSIEESTGEVTLALDPEDETQSAYSVTVVATDSAGNSSEQAISLFSASPALIYQGVDQSFKITNPLPVFTGTAQPASQVNIYLDGTFLASVDADERGSWAFSPSEPLVDGFYAYSFLIDTELNAYRRIDLSSFDAIGGRRSVHEWKNIWSFAALKSDGGVVSWGNPITGGELATITINSDYSIAKSVDKSDQLKEDVVQVFSNEYAFAALKRDGSVVTWGYAPWGGDAGDVADQLQSGVVKIYSTRFAFAALKEDGSVLTWGDPGNGGDSSGVDLGSGVVRIFSTMQSFAALKNDGSVVAWGQPTTGGDAASVSNLLNSGVVDIAASSYAFSALKSNGSVVSWSTTGGPADTSSVSHLLASGVERIYGGNQYMGFAAIKNDGSLVRWGGSMGGIDNADPRLQEGVVDVIFGSYSFVVLKDDGSIVTPLNASDWFGMDQAAALNENVVSVVATNGAFAALKNDGSVISFGRQDSGGDSSAVLSDLQSDVVSIFAGDHSFAALKTDGSLVTWGDPLRGGDSSAVKAHLLDGITHVFSTAGAFAALKEDGSVVTWGDPEEGGDSSHVEDALASNVVAFSDPLHDDNLTLSVDIGSLPVVMLDLDSTPPDFESGVVADSIDENSGAGQLVYQAVAKDNSLISYSLDHWVGDFDGFSIDELTGDVFLKGNPDFERKSSYVFSVVAEDSYGNKSSREVHLPVNNVHEVYLPSAPDLLPESDTGFSSQDNITYDSRPVFQGSSDPGVRVDLLVNSELYGSTFADEQGLWQWNSDVNWSDGIYEVTAQSSLQIPSFERLNRSSLSADERPPGRSWSETRNPYAMAGLRADGSVVAWGEPDAGGDLGEKFSLLQSDVIQIYSAGSLGWRSKGAFAALKKGGSVVTWGDKTVGGDSSAVNSLLESNVVHLASTRYGFAALKSDGSVVSWGGEQSKNLVGDNSDLSLALAGGVEELYSNTWLFLAVKDDSSLVAWDSWSQFTDLPSKSERKIESVFSTESSFALLFDNGSVQVFGSPGDGGDASEVSHLLEDGVLSVAATVYSFAALKEDGSVVAWGDGLDGGDPGGSAHLLDANVVKLVSNRYNFAALKDDSTAVFWGRDYGSEFVVEDVESIVASGYGFAVIKQDGTLAFSSGQQSEVTLTGDVIDTATTSSHYAILQSDGSVLTSWGVNSQKSLELQSGVVKIYSNGNAFAALKEDGSLVVWGAPDNGGEVDGLDSEMFGDFVSIADPYHDERLVLEAEMGSLPSAPLSVTIDTTSPNILHPFVVKSVNNPVGQGQVIYSADSSDLTDVFYDLRVRDSDLPSFGIDADSGDVVALVDLGLDDLIGQDLTIEACDLAGNKAVQQIELIANPIPALTAVALRPWSYTFPADLFFDPDSEPALSVDSGLPSWLSYDPLTATFSGTPSSSADSLGIELFAADDLGSVSTSLNLTVHDVQTVTAPSSSIKYQGGSTLSLPLTCRTTDNQPSTGLSFRLHYDSSLFSFSSLSNSISEILGYSISSDAVDADNNPHTDTVLHVAVSSFPGSLASGTQLGTFNFDVADLPPANPNGPDPITGLRPSLINLTASETAFGYAFAADPIILEPILFDLDVDGDGRVTALGDGLMIIRKLFGSAFAGEALCNKAISPLATRTCDEIHDYIQSGIDGGFLDVDRDARTTALGDGLMVIRRLFGPAFAGDALISKAISSASPYYGEGNAWGLVAANIDLLLI